MFRIEIFCHDKHLGDVLRSIAGKAIGNPNVQPVANAAEVKGKVVAKTSGDVSEMFLAWLAKKHLDEFTVKQVYEFLPTVGRGRTAASYLLTRTHERGLINKHKGKGGNNGMSYSVKK